MVDKTKVVKVSALLLDSQNPRHDILKNQREIIGAMLDGPDSNQLYVLANSIVVDGLNPSELCIAVPQAKLGNAYVVLEGNRRVAALKILENEELLRTSSTLDRRKRADWQALARRYQKDGSRHELPCCVFGSREEANPWIRLKHTGANEGAGVVGWGPEEIARFQERFSGRKPRELALLEYAKQHSPEVAAISSGKKRFPFTTFKRLAPQICKQWGITYVDQTIQVPKEAKKRAIEGITEIIRDLSKRTKKVDELLGMKQRLEYVQRVDRLVGGMVENVEKPWPAQSAEPSGKAVAGKKPRQSPYMIPSEFNVTISHPRIRAIYVEPPCANIPETTPRC